MTDNDRAKPSWPVVYYDSDCPMCRTFVSSLDSPVPTAPENENAPQPQFKSFRSSALPEGLSPEAVEKELHVTTAGGRILKGADAVLYILEQTQRLKWLVWLGRLPGIHLIARMVYALIAANRFAIFSPHRRVFFAKLTVVIAFLIPMPITWKLFYGETIRFYPTTPISKVLPALPVWLEHLVFFSMILCLLLILCTSRPRRLILWFLLASGVYSLWDQSRWMPYYVEYWWMLLVLALFPWQLLRFPEQVGKRADYTLNTLGVILIGIWFWSGLHKINARYLGFGFPWMLSPFTGELTAETKALIHSTALLSPLVETGGALLLLFAVTRPFAVCLLVVMHLFILVTFGPFGLNINHSVWSWNVAHIVLVLLIFWRRPHPTARQLLIGETRLHKFLAVLFCVMPVLNYWGYWDDFASHALYSWSTTEAEITVSDEVKPLLSEDVRANIVTHQDRQFVHVLNWSYYHFESPPYHADRVFFSLMSKLCRTTNNSPGLELVIYDRPPWNSTISPKRRYGCTEIPR